MSRHFAERALRNIWAGLAESLRLDVDRPMNVSAMTRLVSTFPEALGALVIFREEYCRRFQIAQLSLFDLWRAKRSTFQRTSLARCLPLAAAARRPRAVSHAPMKPP